MGQARAIPPYIYYRAWLWCYGRISDGWCHGGIKGDPTVQKLELSDSVGGFGDAVLHRVPGTILIDFVVAKAAGDAVRLARIQVVHEMEVQVRRGAVAGMADVGQMLTGFDPVARGHLDRAHLRMGIHKIAVAALDDDVIAGQRPQVGGFVEVERPGVLEHDGNIPHHVDGVALGPTVRGLHHDAIRGRGYGLTPAVAILQTDAEQQVLQRAGTVEAHGACTRLQADEIIGVALAEHVGPVAGNFGAGGVGGEPFAPQGEVNDDGSLHPDYFSLV